MSKRSKACAISPKVKQAVYERDKGRCIICGRNGIPNAHYIRRSQGGLGIEQNVVTLCQTCHHRFDNGDKRKEIGAVIADYLKRQYPGWDKEDVIFRKGST